MSARTKHYVAASSLPLASRCAGALALPTVRSISVRGADRIGNALHDHLRDRVAYGVSEAMARLPAHCLRYELDETQTSITIARARGFEWTPPRGALPEVMLVLFRDGSVRPVKDSDNLGEDAILLARVDVFWAEPLPLYRDAEGNIRCPPESILWVPDLKTGSDQYPDPVERNAQILCGMLLAALWTGAAAAIPGIIYLRKGPGLWEVPEEPFTMGGIERVRDVLIGIADRVRAARLAHERGEPVPLTIGPHCGLCSSRTYCPAQVGLLRTVLGDTTPYEAHALTREQAIELARLEPLVRRFHESIRPALVSHVEVNGPIPMGDGKQWGPYPGNDETTLAPAAIRDILIEEFGEDEESMDNVVKNADGDWIDVEGNHVLGPRRLIADAFTEVSTSRGRIESAVKAEHLRTDVKRQGAASMRRIMAKAIERGALTKSPGPAKWGAHKIPSAVLPKSIIEVDGIEIDEDAEAQ